MKLTFGQWLKFGFGLIGWTNRNRPLIEDLQGLRAKYPNALADLADVWNNAVPPLNAPIGNPFQPSAEPMLTHVEALHKVQTGKMTEGERQQFERASRPDVGGVG